MVKKIRSKKKAGKTFEKGIEVFEGVGSGLGGITAGHPAAGGGQAAAGTMFWLAWKKLCGS
ncbi:hypothetical protein ACFUV2_04010 [Streptomyces pilosus]|uniref:hypothetical protein n=1 Tax=Streptomyces pilosus TaxID=28893 RepID=UPI0036268C88